MIYRKPRILLDCDGVTADFVDGALAIVHCVTGRRYAPEDVKAFDFCKSLGLSPAERTAVMGSISTATGFCAGLTPYPDAIDGVRRLRDVATIHVVTSPWNSNKTWTYEREAWLACHFGISPNHVHHSGEKYLYGGDMFVDDKNDHVAAWIEEHPGKVAVLWRTPHNQTEQLPYGARETSSWKDLERWAIDLVRPTQTEIKL